MNFLTSNYAAGIHQAIRACRSKAAANTNPPSALSVRWPWSRTRPPWHETRLSAIEAAAQNIEPLATNTRIVLAAVATDPRHRNYILRVMSAGFISAPYEFFPSVARARQWIAETADVPVAQQAGASSFEP